MIPQIAQQNNTVESWRRRPAHHPVTLDREADLPLILQVVCNHLNARDVSVEFESEGTST
jgi:hypothetical protein